MSVTNEDSNASHQRKAPDARQSEVSIYKLYSEAPEIMEMYIGCTKTLFTHIRKQYYTCHASTTSRHNVYLYRIIREHGGWNDWIYEILETVTLTTIERRKLKRHYIETLKATLNTYLPTRTARERKSNARRKARYAKQQQIQQDKARPV